jgi:NIMA (never in mitosis gene a)-related kinase 2
LNLSAHPFSSSLIKTCRQERTALQEDVIWNIVAQVVAALKHCHAGTDEVVLHRDIKPGNIFLDASGNVKLGDFGLARVLSAESLFAQTWVGTPFYMSPEQVDGLAYNEKSDIWALGCLAYELACLRPPFSGANPLALARGIKAGRFPRIPAQYSGDLARFIARLLDVDAAQRPTADELERVPQIQLFNRESRLKVHYTVLKKREEDVTQRERRVQQREQELARKAQRLAAQMRLVGIDDIELASLCEASAACDAPAAGKENRADPSPLALRRSSQQQHSLSPQ